jgi:hypothetical protein
MQLALTLVLLLVSVASAHAQAISGGTVSLPIGGAVGGSGTSGTLPVFTATQTLGNSLLTQSGSVVQPATDLAASLAGADRRFDYLFVGHGRFGNVSGSHTNTLLHCGSGDTARLDFASVGTGSGFTAIYGCYNALTLRFTGDGNSTYIGAYDTIIPVADGVARTTGDMWVRRIEMQSSYDANLTIPNLYGLDIVYSKPAQVTNAVPLRVTGGTVSLASLGVGDQATGSTLTVTNTAFANSVVTLKAVGSHVLAMQDASNNAHALQVFSTATVNAIYSGASVTVPAAQGFTITDAAGRQWGMNTSGDWITDTQRDICSAAVPCGTIRATRHAVWTATDTQPKADMQAGLFTMGIGGATAPSVRWSFTGTAASQFDSDGVGGALTTVHKGTFTSDTLGAATRIRPTGFLFAVIATNLAQDGDVGYCSDCTIANPCAGSGTGAIAKRLNGVNVCN